MPDAVGPVVAAVLRDVAEPVAVGAGLFVGCGAQEPNGSSVPS
jgi:hypothetical protein